MKVVLFNEIPPGRGPVQGIAQATFITVVTPVDSRLRGLGSNIGQVTVLYSWTRHFTLIVPV